MSDPALGYDGRLYAAAAPECTDFQMAGICGIPTSARSVTVNVTVASPTGLGNVTIFPADLPVPLASTINFALGRTRANNAIVNLSTTGVGSIGARAFVAGGGQVHLIVDVTGYFE